MNEEQIRTFLSVAEEGSFSRAQEKEYISKQAMLKQINKLEEEIGCPLFVRGKNGVTLTPSGEIFRRGVIRLQRQLDRLTRQCREAAAQGNTLRIGNVEHQVLLSPVTQLFTQRYPQIRLITVVHPNHSGEWRVENGIQDVAETFYNEQTDQSDYTFIPLTMKPYVLAMRREHPLSGRAQQGSLSLNEASGYDMYYYPIMVGRELGRWIRDIFDQTGNASHLFPREDVDNQVAVAYECVGSDSILLTANPFITAIPELRTMPLRPQKWRQYGIIYKEPMTDAVEKYIDLAREYYAPPSE